MAPRLVRYIVLLFVVLGACPQNLQAAQRRKPVPPAAALLPAEEAWRVMLPAPPAAPGALDAAAVYIPLQSGQLVSLDRETGATHWSVTTSSRWTPLLDGERVYAAGASEVSALRPASGEVVWSAALGAELASAPLLAGETLVTLDAAGELRAMSRQDGRQLWATRVVASATQPAVGTGPTRVCVAWTSRLSCLALADGSLQWERTLAGTLTQPAVTADRVLVGSTDNSLYALSSSDGRLAWKWQFGGDVVGTSTDSRAVYVAALDGLLRALHGGSGNQIWKRQLSTRTMAPPESFGGIVAVAGNQPMLATFNAATGEPIGSLPSIGLLRGPPLVDSTLRPFSVSLVAITREGRVVAFRSTGMLFREPASVPLPALPGRALPREPFSIEGLR